LGICRSLTRAVYMKGDADKMMQMRLSVKTAVAAAVAVICGISIAGVMLQNPENEKCEVYRSLAEDELDTVETSKDAPREAEAVIVRGRVIDVLEKEEQISLVIRVENQEESGLSDQVEVLVSDYFYGQVLEWLGRSSLRGRRVSLMAESYNYLDYYKLSSEQELFVRVRNNGRMVYENIEQEILVEE